MLLALRVEALIFLEFSLVLSFVQAKESTIIKSPAIEKKLSFMKKNNCYENQTKEALARKNGTPSVGLRVEASFFLDLLVTFRSSEK
ncbi:MAG: hypothetical protein EPN37_10115 [Chitinophagaceae bacterium]|nr:MAG: hypothetical protein EPN37_10115 [Chitinophagaceae bacterium]